MLHYLKSELGLYRGLLVVRKLSWLIGWSERSISVVDWLIGWLVLFATVSWLVSVLAAD